VVVGFAEKWLFVDISRYAWITRYSENGAGRRSRGPPTDIAAYRSVLSFRLTAAVVWERRPQSLVVRAVLTSNPTATWIVGTSRVSQY
jgi:hypothetical protein